MAPDLPLWIDADASRLVQLLLNLLGNAIKFTDAVATRAAPACTGCRRPTRAIRQLKGAAAAIPIVMVSADILSGAREAALQAGVSGFIAKPVNPGSLRQALALGRLAAAQEPDERRELPASSSSGVFRTPKAVLDTTVYQAFVALMPRKTIDRQWHALFGPDSPEITVIASALAAHDWPTGTRRAHQLKGVCMPIAPVKRAQEAIK